MNKQWHQITVPKVARGHEQSLHTHGTLFWKVLYKGNSGCIPRHRDFDDGMQSSSHTRASDKTSEDHTSDNMTTASESLQEKAAEGIVRCTVYKGCGLEHGLQTT